jgi:L-rhamnose mutarotase
MKNKSVVIVVLLILASGCFVACQKESEMNAAPAQRFGSLIRVKPEYEERYIILHRHTHFPGVSGSHPSGQCPQLFNFFAEWTAFFLFRVYWQGFSLRHGNQSCRHHQPEWWKLTDPMQEPLPSRKEGEWWAAADEVLYVESQKKIPQPQRWLPCQVSCKCSGFLPEVLSRNSNRNFALHSAVAGAKGGGVFNTMIA